MGNVLKYVSGGIIWTAVCFRVWANAVFFGLPKTHEDLIKMGYSEFQLAIQDIVAAVIPVLWIAVPVLLYLYLKRRRGK